MIVAAPMPRRRKAIRPTRVAAEAARYIVLIGALAVFALPIYWMVAAALKPMGELAADPFAWPGAADLGNLVRAWTVGHYGDYLLNTVIYCTAIVAGVCALACFGGYAFGVLEFPGRDLLFVVFLVGMVVPFQAVMIPEYYLVRDLRILGTMWAYILPATAFGLGFGMFMMRAFFRGLPREIASAARLDGANEWQVFWQIMLPLARPGLATLVVFQFMFTWKNFLIPLVLVQSESLRPVSLGITFFFGRYTSDLGLIAAGVTLASLPMIALYVVLQRHVTRGITQGALKG